MFYDCREFFTTEELHELYPKLTVREDKYNDQDYVVFSNPGKIVDNEAPEYPVGIELWVGHMHERNVDGNIYNPLRFYHDQRGRTEDLTGSVYGEIGTVTEVLTQHIYAGYEIDVMFGELIKLAGSRYGFLVRTPYEVERLLANDPTSPQCVMIRMLNDDRSCAVTGTTSEPSNMLYHCLQSAADRYRRFEFIVYPLTGAIHPSRAQTISPMAYVHLFATMYDSSVMKAHHDRAGRSRFVI